MGHILNETPETEGFQVELRRESFYLHDLKNTIIMDGIEGGGGTLEIGYEDIPQLRAVLDLVEAKRTTPKDEGGGK